MLVFKPEVGDTGDGVMSGRAPMGARNDVHPLLTPSRGGLTLVGDSGVREEELEAPEEAEGQEEEEEEGSGRWAAGPQLRAGGCWGDLRGCEVTPPTPAERGNVVQRVLNTLRFLWVLCRAMVDGLTQWLDTCTREHADMSTVLCLERYVLTRRLATVSPGRGTSGHDGGGGGDSPAVALTCCPLQGEDMHRGVLDELYLLPPEEPPAEELNPRGAGGADPQNGVASRQVHRLPPPRGQPAAPRARVGEQGAHSCPHTIPSGHQGATPGPVGCPLPTGSQEQVTILESQEDVAGSQELLALPQNRSRTASELLLSRYGDVGMVGMGMGMGGVGASSPPPLHPAGGCTSLSWKSRSGFIGPTTGS